MDSRKYELAIFLADQDARRMVSGVLRALGHPVGRSYLSGEQLRRDTGRRETPRYILYVTRAEGERIIAALEAAAANAGLSSLWDAGIEVYFD